MIECILVAMDVHAVADRFVARTLPKEEWTHQAHLAVGMWHVHQYGATEALSRLRDGIRNLNVAHGTINSESSGYHETITRAYVHLLREFLQGAEPNTSLQDRVENLLTSPLAQREALFTFYSRDRLISAEARLGWVEPDVMPLRLAALRHAKA